MEEEIMLLKNLHKSYVDQQDELENLNVSSKQNNSVEQIITKYLGECLSTPEAFSQLNNIINSASLLTINYKPLLEKQISGWQNFIT